MGAVAVFCTAVECGASCIKIPAVYVIDIAVSVIVDAVAGNLARVRPHGILKFRVAVINAGVNNSYRYLSSGTFGIGIILLPGRKNINIHAGFCLDNGRLVFDHTGTKIRKGDGSRTAFSCAVHGIQRTKTGCHLNQLKLAVIFQAPLVGGIAVS